MEESGNTNLKVLKMLAETSKENEALQKENLRLKAQIKELQSKDSTK